MTFCLVESPLDSSGLFFFLCWDHWTAGHCNKQTYRCTQLSLGHICIGSIIGACKRGVFSRPPEIVSICFNQKHGASCNRAADFYPGSPASLFVAKTRQHLHQASTRPRTKQIIWDLKLSQMKLQYTRHTVCHDKTLDVESPSLISKNEPLKNV